MEAKRRRRGGAPLAVLGCALLVSGLAVSCAANSEVGVRPDYKRQQVMNIALTPFYAKSQFGLSGDELDALLASCEEAAVDSLRSMGIDVVAPEEFRTHLDEQEVASRFDDGVPLRSSLSTYFEPAEAERRSDALEVTTVSGLHREDKLPAEALLFGELVYHTRTECRADPTDYNDHAEIVYLDEASQHAPRGPCLVTHVRAKLVDAENGQTMWFNTLLLQTHLTDSQGIGDDEHVAEAVARTIGGEEGLSDFVGGADSVTVEGP